MALRTKLLRWIFHRLYRQWASAYDAVSWVTFGGQWQRWQRASLDKVTGSRVLEVGFGTGDLLLALSERGYVCYGLDSSRRMIQITARKLQQAHHSAALCLGQAREIPFCGASFNSVVLTFPAEFIYDAGFWEEVGRVLVPGGKVIVVDGGQLKVRGPLSFIRSWAIGLALGTSRGKPPAVAPEKSSLQFRYEEWADKLGSVWIVVGEKKKE